MVYFVDELGKQDNLSCPHGACILWKLEIMDNVDKQATQPIHSQVVSDCNKTLEEIYKVMR